MNLNQADTGRISVGQIDSASKAAALHCWSQVLPMDERYETAWGAIAEAAASSDDRMRYTDMIQIGKEAIDDEARDWGRHHGRSNGRSFQAFWLDRYELDAANNKFEARLVDQLALAQIMAVLPGRMSTALIALAIAGDLSGAAQLLGQHYDTVTRNVRDARRAIYAMWFEGQTPPDPPIDRRVESYQRPRAEECPQGHELTADNVYRLGRTGRTCRACQIARSAARRAARPNRLRGVA